MHGCLEPSKTIHTGWPVCHDIRYPSQNRVKIALSSQVAILLGSERRAKVDVYCLK